MERSYQAKFTPVRSLRDEERQAMAKLYLQYYENADESMFYRDLDAKTEVETLRCDGELVGFSALLVYEAEWRERSVNVVYSGDTIVRREHWGQQAMAAEWLRRASEIRSASPGTPLYWFLLVKGHRTYRFMPLYFIEFFPNFSSASPECPELKRLADELAHDKFGAAYNPETGVIEFAKSQGNLRDEIAHPTEREMKNPAVRYFLEKNPGYLRGHELVCLCRVEPDNLRPFARRIFEAVRS